LNEQVESQPVPMVDAKFNHHKVECSFSPE